jgi:hypothetical protein
MEIIIGGVMLALVVAVWSVAALYPYAASGADGHGK